MALATCLQCRQLTGDIDSHVAETHDPFAYLRSTIALPASTLRSDTDAMVNSLRPKEIDVLLRMEVSAGADAVDQKLRERAEARIAQLKNKLGLKS